MKKLYRSGLVQRYHSNPDFARFGQTNAQHQWGVAVLVLQLNPNPSKNLITAAILHDVGEMGAGDMSRTFKRVEPAFAERHRSLEHGFRDDLVGERLKNSFLDLSTTKKVWLSMCDGIEAFLFAVHHNSSAIAEDSWPEHRSSVLSQADELGCFDAVRRLLS